MLDLNTRSAPTSLTMASKEQQLNLNNNNRSSFKSSLSELSSTSTLNDNYKNAIRSENYESQLIDSKFNELAKKILEELKYSQYSKEFFKALDSILKEPMTKTIKRNTHKHLVFYNRNQNVNYIDQRNSEQQSNNLFAKNAHPNQKQQQQRNLTKQQILPQKQKSAIPVIASNGYSSSPKKSPIYTTEMKNQITKSATTGDVTLRRQSNPLKTNQALSTQQNTGVNGVIKSRVRDNSSQNIRNYSSKLSKVDDDEVDDDEDDTGEGEDDDVDNDSEIDVDEDEMENDENDNIRRSTSSYKGLSKHSYLNNNNRKQLNPIAKSKTLSNATEICEAVVTREQRQPISSIAKHQPSTVYLGQKSLRPNPIVRSNTLTTTHSYKPASNDRETHRASPNETKSMVLNSRDIGELYKPHMNYSTSVLGNHRLSDDDEIIIIPTQSPTLVSTSPDGDVNLDELNERFSISRTKSFWEKLSKGSHNRRVAKETTAESSTNSCKISANNYANKNIGSRVNEHAFDRMDSTGGSNSNYNGSSSGDENGGCYSQQHPTIRELQEMSRENRLRQTR